MKCFSSFLSFLWSLNICSIIHFVRFHLWFVVHCIIFHSLTFCFVFFKRFATYGCRHPFFNLFIYIFNFLHYLGFALFVYVLLPCVSSKTKLCFLSNFLIILNLIKNNLFYWCRFLDFQCHNTHTLVPDYSHHTTATLTFVQLSIFEEGVQGNELNFLINTLAKI